MDKETLAKRIGDLRGRETQVEFGKRLGVSRQTVMRWEKAEAVPPESILEQLGIRIEFVEAG